MSEAPPPPFPGAPEPPGPRQMGPVTTKFAKVDPGPSQTFGWTGFSISAVGVVFVLVSFTAIAWLRDGNLKFRDVHSVITTIDDSGIAQVHPLAKIYFSWLAWLALLVVALGAVLAATPSVSGPFRVLTPLLAAGAIAVTLVAVDITSGNGYHFWISDARVGFYMALVGFLLAGIGATLGTGHERR
jgi:hypothetical protein